jgi:hypothetical protein
MKSEQFKIYVIYFTLIITILTLGMLTNVC